METWKGALLCFVLLRFACLFVSPETLAPSISSFYVFWLALPLHKATTEDETDTQILSTELRRNSLPSFTLLSRSSSSNLQMTDSNVFRFERRSHSAGSNVMRLGKRKDSPKSD
mmetsp:Transcript_44342/g.87564  ORF Transcript_44342/g.87564 Transcript_44342/m.87564 type:complete len:114 (-) Transcript_44342:102-443(-)